jgi:tripartite-type tricarboxylate transporter receptor subunit TctC
LIQAISENLPGPDQPWRIQVDEPRNPLAKRRVARAQGYPSRYVRLIVQFPPGGSADPLARVLANRLSEVWGQQVVVENKGGAGGNIGAAAVAQATPDGYTLLIGLDASFTINPYIYSSLGYDPSTDLAPVTRLCTFTNLMVVPNSSPAKSVTEFINHAKANRGKITFASPGTGTPPHLSGELFKRMASIEMTHVPYRGGGPAFNDLIPGRVDVMFATMPSVLAQVQSGVLRGLAVTSAVRSPFVPTIPTIAESGVGGFDVSDGYGLYLPAKTLAEIARKVRDDAVEAMAHPAVKQRLEEIAMTVVTSTPTELAALLKSEAAKWGPIIKAAGIKGE